jgi:hypothetical protein
MKLTLAVRLPAWSKNTVILLNGDKIPYTQNEGYVYIPGPFNGESTITVALDMGVKRIYANQRVGDGNGKVAFSRGPFVYCAEGVDNEGDVTGLRAGKDGSVKAGDYIGDMLYGITPIQVEGYRIKENGALYSYDAPVAEPYEIILIPYYAWGNRGLNQMRVWLPEK